jgi:hypothetical protein
MVGAQGHYRAGHGRFHAPALMRRVAGKAGVGRGLIGSLPTGAKRSNQREGSGNDLQVCRKKTVVLAVRPFIILIVSSSAKRGVRLWNAVDVAG